MAYKDLLVHLGDSKATSSRIEAAIAVAKRQGARITGVAVAAAGDAELLRALDLFREELLRDMQLMGCDTI